MTVALEAAQEVKKSSRRPRGGRNDKAETSSGASFIAWLLQQPTPLWGLGAAAFVMAGTFVAWQWYRSTDLTPLRWSHEKETYSDCFKTLTTPSPSSTDNCFHAESEQIQQRYFDWINPSVAVYSTGAPPHPSPTLRDLADQGQAEAIRFLEQDSALNGKAWTDLGDALDDSKIRVGERDPFEFDRVLIANVAKGVDWKPGDRMMWTRVLIEPINFSFAGYSVAETNNETLKVTSVERTNSRKFSADLSATIPGMEGPKADLGPSSEHSVKTNSDINAQYEKLGIDILPNFLRITRESETGGDAVGNTEVTLTAAADPETIWKRYPSDKLAHPSGDAIVLLVTGTHFDGDGPDDQSAKDENKPAVDILPEVPVPHCALRARVWLIYEERKVEKGRESYDESKQEVTLAHDAEDKQDVDIVSADEVSPAVWSLKLCEDAQCADDHAPALRAMVPPSDPQSQNPSLWRKVVFTDYGVAIRLARWMRTHSDTKPPHTDIQFNYHGQSDKNYVSLVPVKTTKDECKPEGEE
jgi:hypothetical protein